jgi:hypothetical protein
VETVERRPSYPEWRKAELFEPWVPIDGFDPPMWRFKNGKLDLRGHATGPEGMDCAVLPMFRLPVDVATYVIKHLEPHKGSPWGPSVSIAASGLFYACPDNAPGFPPREPTRVVRFAADTALDPSGGQQ